ncbi:MAG: S8 family serine peptidase [Pseudomonadota bacterium]
MKYLISSVMVLGSLKVSAATIVQFRDHVKTLPSSFQLALKDHSYEIKPSWKESRMTIQRLPTSTWDQIKRQPNLAIRIAEASFSLSLKEDPAIERVLFDADFTNGESQKVQQVSDPSLPCKNSIYLGEYSAKISQNLTEEKNCDGFWVFPEENTPYEFSVSNGKTMEVYEDGKRIFSGSKSVDTQFKIGSSGQIVVVKGKPGPYTVSWKPLKYKEFKRVATFGEDSNAFGFGSIEASKAFLDLTGNTTEKSSQVNHQGAYMMNVGSLWAKGIKGEQTRVAIIDTGVDFSHPFLKDVLEEGINISDPGHAPDDDESHGTHVAGIIHQVAPLTKIVPVKVLDKNGSGSIADIVKGIEWAIDQGVDVINLSIGGDVDESQFFHVLEKAASHGILVAMASGNDSRFLPTFPANYVSTIENLGFAVGALNLNRALTLFSDRSGTDPKMKYVAAFGEMVNSSVPGGGYKKFSGTSMATPQVSGLFALLKSLPEKMSSSEILNALRKSVLLTSLED